MLAPGGRKFEPQPFTSFLVASSAALQKHHLASIVVMTKKQLVSHDVVAKPFTTVVLIHGIRTQASWAEMVAAVMRDEGHVNVVPIRYGYFDVFKFISPFGTRGAATKKVLRELRSVLRREDPRRVLVIAHSFGSYLVTKILADEGDIEFGGLVLCGSVVDDKYRWDLVRSRVADRVVNECGDQDVWPVLASKISWGYGPSGTTGFGSSNVRDRFHDLAHSGFFSVDFVRTFWVPLVAGWEVVGTPFEMRRGIGPWWRGPLIAFPLKTIVGIAVLWFATAMFQPVTSDRMLQILSASPSSPARASEKSRTPDATQTGDDMRRALFLDELPGQKKVTEQPDSTTYEARNTGVTYFDYGIKWLPVRSTPPRQWTVADVVPDSDAARAGVKRGDSIYSIDGIALQTSMNVTALNNGLFPATMGERHTFVFVPADGSAQKTVILKARL